MPAPDDDDFMRDDAALQMISELRDKSFSHARIRTLFSES